ncbi:MAG: fused DSP-PTPase phosphatase/NAD kinase-like protein [Phycisphaerae bacterium]
MGFIRWLRQRFGLEDAVFLDIEVEGLAGKMFVSPMPFGPYDKLNQLMKFYRDARVETVIPLVTDEEIARKAKRDVLGAYEKAGIEIIRFPIADLTSPPVEDVCRLVKTVSPMLKDGRRIAVHCNAGTGRTAVIVACLVADLLAIDGTAATAYIESRMATQLIDSQKRVIERFAELPGDCCDAWDTPGAGKPCSCKAPAEC